MQPTIETPRLIIRELLPEDKDGIFEMDSDPEVHRYIHQSPIKTMQEAVDAITFIRQQYADNGIGRWAVLDKTTNEFLGWTGFKLMTDAANGHINHYDFGYRLKRSAWGKGIASESGIASLEYGLKTLRLNPIFAMTDVGNVVSRHILEKLGFRFVEVFNYDGPLAWGTPPDRLVTWYELPSERHQTPTQ